MKVLLVFCLSFLADQAFTQTLDSTACDTIILINGNHITCRIDSITQNQVIYHQCGSGLKKNAIASNMTDRIAYGKDYQHIYYEVDSNKTFNVINNKNGKHALIQEIGDKVTISHLNDAGELTVTKGVITQIEKSEIKVDSIIIRLDEIVSAGKKKNKKLKIGGLIIGSGIGIIGAPIFLIESSCINSGWLCWSATLWTTVIVSGTGIVTLLSTGVYAIIESIFKSEKKNKRISKNKKEEKLVQKYTFATHISLN